MRDRLYHSGTDLVDFAFDEKVTRVFGDMIRRSVPGYELVIPMTGVFAAEYLRPGTRCYDLGCSRGATLQAIARFAAADGAELVGVDSSSAMIAACRELQLPGARFLQADLRDVTYADASFMALNFTLQFLPTQARTPLLARLREALDGALVISEKVAQPEAVLQARLTHWHEAFKRANGYSDLEIAGKRAALENVLVPDTPATLEERLRDAGFRTVTCWFSCLNFNSWLAES